MTSAKASNQATAGIVVYPVAAHDEFVVDGESLSLLDWADVRFEPCLDFGDGVAHSIRVALEPLACAGEKRWRVAASSIGSLGVELGNFTGSSFFPTSVRCKRFKVVLLVWRS